MRYQNVAAFDKHLKEAFFDHLAHIYLIVASCDFERKRLAEKIIKPLCAKEKEAHHSTFDALVSTPEAALGALETNPLFGGFSIVFWDNVDKLKETAKLAAYFAHPSPKAFLILGASPGKQASELYQKGKKEVVALDLSDEKPWERQRRLGDFLMEEAKRAGKRLESAAAAFLLEKIGLDLPALEQELEKLICYGAEKEVLTLKDVQLVSSARDLATGWQIAEALVFSGQMPGRGKTGDPAFLLPFIGQLRYQLQTGGQIAACLEKKLDPARFLPQIRPQTMEKYVQAALQKKRGYFERGLLALYDLEVAAKTGSADVSILFDRFAARLFL